MKKFQLIQFADENGNLNELEDANFLLRKINNETILDFNGINSVSDDYLQVILKDQEPVSLEQRLEGMNESVEHSLVKWVENLSQPVKIEPERETTNIKSIISEKKSDTLKYIRKESEGEKYTPTRLVSKLKQQLRNYIEGAYPLSDPILVRSRRKLLDEANNGHLLAQEPYVETTPRYETFIGGYEDLGLPEHISKLFKELAKTKSVHYTEEEEKTLLFPKMYSHQEKSFKSFFKDKKDLIIATGTGSGKTECFLIPLLGHIYNEAYSKPDSFRKPGVRAMILYPMNALVNDQLSRLRLLFGDPGLTEKFPKGENKRPHLTFGMYTGRTKYPGPRDPSKDRERVEPFLNYYREMDPNLLKELKKLGRHPAKDLEHFYAKQHHHVKTGKNGKSRNEFNWDKRLHTHTDDIELLTRQEMVNGAGSLPGHSPDILITNYCMLEYMLMRPFERPIFDETKEWLENGDNQFLLILDEAHMYRGARGAEVAFLIRRLKARLGIENKPEKFRVICTSASLGSDETALENVCRFASDLTGKKPDNFVSIKGDRYVPEITETGNEELGEILANMEIEHLHASVTTDILFKTIEPLFDYLNYQCNESKNEEELLRHLYYALKDSEKINKVINLLMKATSINALSLNDLSETLFPDYEKRKKAVEILLTLGSIARINKDEGGLIPTRIHAMFRGLHAIYACINETCSGRQDSPGKKSIVGKLFSDPQTTCDDCGSRVFELASCRYCGTSYIYSYTAKAPESMDFLWKETEGNLNKIELLPTKPRFPEVTEEIKVHLKTGYLDIDLKFPEEETRSFWLQTDKDGKRSFIFEKCAMCQSSSSRTKSRISNFRTKGEQPFTALIESQFSEQPPQNPDPDNRLPNKGRKVLVFSDGRQKAARLAPALQYSHSRDLFRQVLALAASELENTNFQGMHFLYPAVLWVCNKWGLNLFPEPDNYIFHDHLIQSSGKTIETLINDQNSGYLSITQSFAEHLYAEMTDRYYSLNSLALSYISEDPVISKSLFSNFPEIGLKEENAKIILNQWIRTQFESRRFLPPNVDLSTLKTNRWDEPQGIELNKRNDIFPERFEDYLLLILENNQEHLEKVFNWFKDNINRRRLFELRDDKFYLTTVGLKLNLKLDNEWQCCQSCGKLYAYTLKNICPGCLGSTKLSDPDYLEARTGFYREQVKRAFDENSLDPFSLIAEEHSAQLTGQENEEAFNKTEIYELRFQDIPIKNEKTGNILPPIDILSCTTTMEVGIDIGSLTGVALRNVPPHVSNYQQRAGRAGRRGRSVASVITYAHGTSHDTHYYENPAKIISGDVLAPIVYIENQKVLKRHISAYLIQRFFHEMVIEESSSQNYQLFESLGKVSEFLEEGSLCSLNNLERWLNENRKKLINELSSWVPSFSFGKNEKIENVQVTISESIEELLKNLYSNLPVKELKNIEELNDLQKEGLNRQIEEDLLGTLINRAILPRYAFPMDVVSFWVPRPRQKGESPHKRSFEYEPQRDLQIALSEYAPGSSLTIDKWRFKSEALYSPYEPDIFLILENAKHYFACQLCGFVSLKPDSTELSHCPSCKNEKLFKKRFIIPKGFASSLNNKKTIDRGQGPSYAGQTTRAQMEVQEPTSNWDQEIYDGRLKLCSKSQNLVVVNKGIGDRGFMICPECGLTEPAYGPGFTQTNLFNKGKPCPHSHPLERGVKCNGEAIPEAFYLGHDFITDVLLLQINISNPAYCPTNDYQYKAGMAGRTALTSLVEAICLSASIALQIDEGEMSGNWSPVINGGDNIVNLFLYDVLPGGAGYTRMVKDNLDMVLKEAEKLMSECNCETSCYKCLRHYGNNYYHASLDRHMGLALLKYIKYGKKPVLSKKEKDKAGNCLLELTRLKKLETQQNVLVDNVEVPIIIKRSNGEEIWVDIHHPLIDFQNIDSDIQTLANSVFVEFASFDSYTLQHNLPEALKILDIQEGNYV